jgi:hypothetical protein
MRTFAWLVLLMACGGSGANAERPEGALGLWLSHDGLAQHATDRLTKLPPIGIATPLGVAVARIHDPMITSAACSIEDEAACISVSAEALVSLDMPPFPAAPNIPLSITAKGAVAFTQDHPQALRLRMPSPTEVTLELGAIEQPAMAFLMGLLEGVLVPQINEYLQAGLLIEPAPFVSTYLDEVTVNADGLGVLSAAMNTPPSLKTGSIWHACADGTALTHLLFPSMFLDTEAPRFMIESFRRTQDRIHVRVQSTGASRVKPTVDASVSLTMDGGMLTIEDVALGWEQRPRGIWFGPNIKRLENTLIAQTPYSVPIIGASSQREVQDWTANGSVICVTGS